jgi:hypothetical protein
MSIEVRLGIHTGTQLSFVPSHKKRDRSVRILASAVMTQRLPCSIFIVLNEYSNM